MLSVSLSASEVQGMIGVYLWPLFRIMGLIAAAPIFGVQFIPYQVKLVMGVAITILVAPLLPAPPQVEPISFAAIMIIVQQILIGITMGVVMNLVFNVFIIGGQIIATKMGLGFATVVDPQSGVQGPSLSQFYVFLTSLIFLAVNGHLLLIEVLINSFNTMPIGTEGMGREQFWQLVSWTSEIFKSGVLLALPAVATLLLANLALGVVMRAAPQFNIMSIGFPITLTLGFVVVLLSLPLILPIFTSTMGNGLQVITQMVN